MAENIPAVNPPVSVYPQLVDTKPVILMLTDKILSAHGDSYTVHNSLSGQALLQIEGKPCSLHERKKVTDPSGKLLYSIAIKLAGLHKNFVAEDASGKEILRVQRHYQRGAKVTGSYVQPDGKAVNIEVVGDIWGGSANIQLDNGTTLAHVQRKLVASGRVLADAATYFVTVAPGVDYSLIAAASICFNEVKGETV